MTSEVSYKFISPNSLCALTTYFQNRKGAEGICQEINSIWIKNLYHPGLIYPSIASAIFTGINSDLSKVGSLREFVRVIDLEENKLAILILAYFKVKTPHSPTIPRRITPPKPFTPEERSTMYERKFDIVSKKRVIFEEEQERKSPEKVSPESFSSPIDVYELFGTSDILFQEEQGMLADP